VARASGSFCRSGLGLDCRFLCVIPVMVLSHSLVNIVLSIHKIFRFAGNNEPTQLQFSRLQDETSPLSCSEGLATRQRSAPADHLGRRAGRLSEATMMRVQMHSEPCEGAAPASPRAVAGPYCDLRGAGTARDREASSGGSRSRDPRRRAEPGLPRSCRPRTGSPASGPRWRRCDREDAMSPYALPGPGLSSWSVLLACHHVPHALAGQWE
jgi:hypothetical protein